MKIACGLRRSMSILVLMGSLAACGRDVPKVTRSQTIEFSRFCGLLKEFRATASTTGVAPTPDDFSGPPAAFANLVSQMGPKLEEWRTIAPKDLRSSVQTVTDAVVKAKDADPSGTHSAPFKGAIQEISRFDQLRCQTKMPDQVGGP